MVDVRSVSSVVVSCHCRSRVSLTFTLLLILLLAVPADASSQSPEPDAQILLHALIDRALDVRVPTLSGEEYDRAAEEYFLILTELQEIDYEQLSLDDQVDYELLQSFVGQQHFEISEVELFRLQPNAYIVLGNTSYLFGRLFPSADGDQTLPEEPVRSAIEELERLPAIVRNAKRNLDRPARMWTENAIEQARFAEMLLSELLPSAEVADPERAPRPRSLTSSSGQEGPPKTDLTQQLRSAAKDALSAIREYDLWLQEELLPRSTRKPRWSPEKIEHHQFVHEQLSGYGIMEMIEIAENEERKVMAEMVALADSIHPSGDLERVWELMKDEAPPWDQVLPLAQTYVDLTVSWLRAEGSHVIDLPEVPYGARVTSPMSRRGLPFGGGPGRLTVAGEAHSYYQVSPIEEWETEAEVRERLRSYNPYWTNVISYHEWLGHGVHRLIRDAHIERPMRKAFRSVYFSQAWSFYLEKLLEDEGYFRDRFDHLAALKHRMARLQMRMWRVQRILTHQRLALGEISSDEAVQAFVDKVGMEPTIAYRQVQGSSQRPNARAREIIGEIKILELRDEYQARMGEEFSLAAFHLELLKHGDLPFRQLRRLMFRY